MTRLRGGALIAITLAVIAISAEITWDTYKEMAGPLADSGD